MAGPPPLTGLKVLEFAGLAPGPFAGLLLADSGASVLRIDRANPSTSHHSPSFSSSPPTADMLARHKSSIAVDLKSPAAVALVRRLATTADVLIDPFRPGVLEKLGLGPDELCKANPRLIYGRMTGFRRDGKYKDMAGHDINYLAVSGVLNLLGRKETRPTPPWNILGDFAGGGGVLFQGILLALLARGTSGKGQVVEANMVDGAGYLSTFPRIALKTPLADGPRGTNMLDSGAPWYDTYETKDSGRYMAIGAIEPHFFKILMEKLGIAGRGWEDGKRFNKDEWGKLRGEIDAVFKKRTRAEWEAVFDGTDACCTPVLDYREMQGRRGREGDQRPIVTLKDTPMLAVHQDAKTTAQGQGKGVPGGGYEAFMIGAGEGGEEKLKEWVGWTKGRDYDVVKGGLVLKDKSKL